MVLELGFRKVSIAVEVIRDRRLELNLPVTTDTHTSIHVTIHALASMPLAL